MVDLLRCVRIMVVLYSSPEASGLLDDWVVRDGFSYGGLVLFRNDGRLDLVSTTNDDGNSTDILVDSKFRSLGS